MGTVEPRAGFGIALGDGPTAVGALAARVQQLQQDAWDGAEVFRESLSTAQAERVRKHCGMTNVRFTNTRQSHAHSPCRAVQDKLVEIVQRRLRGRRVGQTVCLVGTTASELERFAAECPGNRFCGVVYIDGPRDNERVDEELGARPARPFAVAVERALLAPGQLGSPVTAWAGFTGPLPRADVYVSVDGVLNLHCAWFLRQMAANGATVLYSIHHSAAELATLPPGRELHHQYLDYHWRRTRDGVYTMAAGHEETPYYHRNAESWWRPQPGWSYSREAGGPGYGLWTYTPLTAQSVGGRIAPQWMWENVWRTFDAQWFYKYGEVRVVYLPKSLLKTGSDYLTQLATSETSKARLDSLVAWFRSRTSVQQLQSREGDVDTTETGYTTEEALGAIMMEAFPVAKALRRVLGSAALAPSSYDLRHWARWFLARRVRDVTALVSSPEFQRVLLEFHPMPYDDLESALCLPDVLLSVPRSFIDAEAFELSRLEEVWHPAARAPAVFGGEAGLTFDRVAASFFGPAVVVGNRQFGIARSLEVGKYYVPGTQAAVWHALETGDVAPVLGGPRLAVPGEHVDVDGREWPVFAWLQHDPRTGVGRREMEQWGADVLAHCTWEQTPPLADAGDVDPVVDVNVRTVDNPLDALAQVAIGDTVFVDKCCCDGFHWGADAGGAGLVPCARQLLLLNEVAKAVGGAAARAVVRLDTPFAPAYVAAVAEQHPDLYVTDLPDAASDLSTQSYVYVACRSDRWWPACDLAAQILSRLMLIVAFVVATNALGWVIAWTPEWALDVGLAAVVAETVRHRVSHWGAGKATRDPSGGRSLFSWLLAALWVTALVPFAARALVPAVVLSAWLIYQSVVVVPTQLHLAGVVLYVSGRFALWAEQRLVGVRWRLATWPAMLVNIRLLWGAGPTGFRPRRWDARQSARATNAKASWEALGRPLVDVLYDAEAAGGGGRRAALYRPVAPPPMVAGRAVVPGPGLPNCRLRRSPTLRWKVLRVVARAVGAFAVRRASFTRRGFAVDDGAAAFAGFVSVPPPGKAPASTRSDRVQLPTFVLGSAPASVLGPVARAVRDGAPMDAMARARAPPALNIGDGYVGGRHSCVPPPAAACVSGRASASAGVAPPAPSAPPLAAVAAGGAPVATTPAPVRSGHGAFVVTPNLRKAIARAHTGSGYSWVCNADPIGEEATWFKNTYIERDGFPRAAVVWCHGALPRASGPMLFIAVQKPAGTPYVTAVERDGYTRHVWFAIAPEEQDDMFVLPGAFGECAAVGLSYLLHGHPVGVHLPDSPLAGRVTFTENELVAFCVLHSLPLEAADGSALSTGKTDRGVLVLNAERSHVDLRLPPGHPWPAAVAPPSLEDVARLAVDVRFFPGTVNALSAAIRPTLVLRTDDPASPEYNQFKNTTEKVIASVNAKLHGQRSCRAVPTTLLSAAPGAGKTYAAARLASSWAGRYGPGTVMYVSPTRASRDEFAGMVNQMRGARVTDETGPYVYARTHIVAFAADPSGERAPVEHGAVTLIIIDECTQMLVPYLAAYCEMNPRARLVLLGDTDQMTLDRNRAYNRFDDAPMARVALADVPGFRAVVERAIDLGPTRRFGPDAARAAKVLCRPSRSGLSLARRGWAVHVETRAAFMQRSEGQRAAVRVLTTDDPAKYDAGLTWPKMYSIASSQGVTCDYVGLVVCGNMLRHFRDPASLHGALYVALTRARSGVVFILEPTLVPRDAALADVVEPYIRAVAGVVGGATYWKTYVRPEHPASELLDMLHPIEPAPSLFTSRPLQKTPMPEGFRFEPSLLSPDTVANGNLWQHTSNMAPLLREPEAVKVRTSKFSGTIRDLLLLGENIPGARHWAGSYEQLAATAAARVAASRKAREVHGRFNPYGNRDVRRIFAESYIDSAKHKQLLESSVLGYVEPQARNEFLRAVGPWQEVATEVTFRNLCEALTQTVRLHLKSQTKPKGLAATLEPKAGQPITAMEKGVNVMYGVLFRVLELNFVNVFRDDVIWASRDTIAGHAARWSEPGEMFAFILMSDAVEFDASHTMWSNAALCTVWSLVNPYAEWLDKYFAYKNCAWVASAAVSYVSLGAMLSGGADTFASNTIKIMLDTAIMAWCGPLGRAWRRAVYRVMFGGDDMAAASRLDPAWVFDYSWANLAYIRPLKTQVLKNTAVCEFFNHVFGHGIAVYRSLIAERKLFCKNYAEVLRSRANWAEFMLAWRDMTSTWAEHFWLAAAMEAAFNGESDAAVEVRMRNLMAFGRLSYVAALRVLPVSSYQVPAFIVLDRLSN